MVGHRSQHRSNRLLLVSPPRAQTALPSPQRGSRCAVSHEPPARVRLEKTTKDMGTLDFSHTPVVVAAAAVVEWLYCSKRLIIVRWADLSDFFR